jgi:flagellum-specific ATP synthase
VNVGAYEKGSNERTDYALEMIDDLNRFLVQGVDQPSQMKEGLDEMTRLLTVRKLNG